MKYWYQSPPEELSVYVRTILILDGSAQSDGNELPLVTSGMQSLICRIEKGNVVQLGLFGKLAPDETWNPAKNTYVIACFFFPFALSCMFDIPASKLVNQPIELNKWNAHTTNALNIQLVHAKTIDAKTKVLHHFLLKQLAENKKHCDIIRYVTDKMMYDPGTEILTGLLQELSMNERSFQRMFKKYVGVTASHFRRICQFQSSFTQLRSGNFENMTDVAYDSGFSDQSHFIRSFKEFTEITPLNYIKHGLKGKKT